MAKINDIYVFVAQEDLTYGVTVTEHTVETGVEISDHVKKRAITLSITGEIVGDNASSTLSKIRKWHQEGALCKYVGRISMSNCLITDLSTTQTHKVWGGYEFSMTLKEVRTSSTSYNSSAKNKATKKTGTQQVTSKSNSNYVYHTVKKGDCVWNLVAASKAPYKNLSRPGKKGVSACNWVMEKNPSAFSRKGDFGTLKIGYKLIVGVRS